MTDLRSSQCVHLHPRLLYGKVWIRLSDKNVLTSDPISLIQEAMKGWVRGLSHYSSRCLPCSL